MEKLVIGILAHVDAGVGLPGMWLPEKSTDRPDPESRKSGSQGRLSGHRRHGAAAGHYDFFQAGGV